jgi:hypothetical protein
MVFGIATSNITVTLADEQIHSTGPGPGAKWEISDCNDRATPKPRPR